MTNSGLRKSGSNIFGDIIWIAILAAIAIFLIVPATHSLFVSVTNSHPYISGFVKFAILSIMGEFLANRLVHKKWVRIKGILAKMFVWGIVGVLIVLMFAIFSQGVQSAIEKGLLYTGSSPASYILKAFYISAILNLTFGPVFMAVHRITDTNIDSVTGNITGNGEKTSLGKVVFSIDWPGFLSFVVGKTIPFFWIPAHTITFLLPDEYKVLFAASLSIVLGMILSYAKLKKRSDVL